MDVFPVNFWNPDQPLERHGGIELAWKSFTTGSAKGLIMILEKQSGGWIEIDTAQVKATFKVNEVSLDPMVWECGGLDIALRVFQLPNRQESNEFSFTLPLTGLKHGDNPVFIRMSQENSHLAWSNPVYVMRK
ncbi:MAG: hypothetical protein MUO42_09270 [Anaerolineaceae bacterium]|nr:hypothetical protein [Anaerolineaceae bacterium]